MLVKRVGLINDDEVHRFNRLVFIALPTDDVREPIRGEVKHSFEPELIVFALVFLFILHSA